MKFFIGFVVTMFAICLLADGATASVSPLLTAVAEFVVQPSAVLQARFGCNLVNGQLVCGDKSGGKADDDNDQSDKHGSNKGKKHKDKDEELTTCSIQPSSGGGGCVTGFKHVCEKMKNGKKCCGCVPDKNAHAPAQAPKVKQFCCSVAVSKGAATSDFCNADRAEAERQANQLKAPGEIPDCYAECFAPDGSSGRKFCH